MQQNTVFGHDTKDTALVKNVHTKKNIQINLTGITPLWFRRLKFFTDFLINQVKQL